MTQERVWVLKGMTMLKDALAALANSAATTLAAAMATDAWQTARDGIVRLFGRDRNRQVALRTRLDEHNDSVSTAQDAAGQRERLIPAWQVDFELLLAQHPEAAQPLAELVEQVRGRLTAAQQAWISAHTIVQNITASGPGAVAGGAIAGNVIFHQDAPGSPGDKQ
jgi:hypothetical protein